MGDLREIDLANGGFIDADPDIFIKPDLAGIRLLHFDRVDEIVEQAAPAAGDLRRQLQALPDCR